jgi:hypothetical protein
LKERALGILQVEFRGIVDTGRGRRRRFVHGAYLLRSLSMGEVLSSSE